MGLPFPARPSPSPTYGRTCSASSSRLAMACTRWPSLAPGEYRLDLELAGFKTVRREGIRLATGEKARIDFDLAVGGLQEQVTVVADAPAIRAETASLGTVVEHEQVVQLPLNGRLFIILAAIAPGVALPPNSVLPRINGGRPRTNEYLFDGISVLQPEPGQVAYYPIVDSIQEFKIESNSPPAEFGRFNGGVVNLTTKSGGNAFDGSRVRILPERAPQRQKLLSAGQSDETGVSPQPVRRPDRRTRGQGSHVFLRGLPGTAPADRPHGHLDGPHRAAAPGDLHGSDRRTGARHLRSGDDRRLEPVTVSRQHDSEERDGSRRARPARALPDADRCRDGEQLQPDSPTKSTIRIRAACASITSSPRAAIRCLDA